MRSQQAKRYLKEIGPLRLFILGGLLIYGFGALWQPLAVPAYAYGVATAVLLSITSLHIQRSDRAFLCNFSRQKPSFFFIAEYLALASPIVVILLLREMWFASSILLIGALLIAHMPVRQHRHVTIIRIIQWIPVKAFEWRSGLRKNLGWFLLIYLVTFASLETPFAIPIALFVLGILSTGFYTEAEPISMLAVVGNEPWKILTQKLNVAFRMMLFLTLPLIGVQLLLYAAWWWLLLYAFLASALLVAVAIVVKYAIYIPSQKLTVGSIFMSFMVVCWVVPYLVPIPLLTFIIYGKKAIQNLKKHL